MSEAVTQSTTSKSYDLFVSYVDEDRKWVEGYLLDALCQAGVRCHHEAAFALGAPRLLEFERAIAQSHRTLLVVSSAYLAASFGQFTALLAQTYGQESGTWPVIPLRLEDVDLPPRLKLVTGLDAITPDGWATAIERLCAELERGVSASPAPPPCPYPGMAPFSEDQSDLFFGREAEVEELLQRLRLHPFLAVIGPSGSGKSSLVSAGLLAALRTSSLFGGGEWMVRRIRPTEAPMGALAVALGAEVAEPVPAGEDGIAGAVAAVLASGSAGARLLLFVDQLEELFTIASDGVLRFQEAVLELARTDRCYVVVTLRADFYPHLMRSRLWPVVRQHRFEVLPLEGNGLRQAIERPAEAVGVFVETALVERLLADASGEPGLLPLMQETMVCLWERLERRLLPLSAYEALVLPHRAYGRTGLQVAMARRADAAMAELSAHQQLVARRIFLRLVQFGEGRGDVRRQQPVSALRSVDDVPATFDHVLEHLAGRRLVTLTSDGKSEGGADDPLVDLAHEALIPGWPTLQAWLADRRVGEQTRRQLVAKASEWTRLGRGDGGLLDRVELLEADRWLSGPDAPELGVDQAVVALAGASRQAIKEAEREREAVRHRELAYARDLATEQERRADVERQRADEQARATTALRRRARALAALAVAMVVVATFATLQRQRADREAQVSLSRQLAAQARTLAEERLDLALLLSLAAHDQSPTLEARSSLLAALGANPRVELFLHGHTDRAGPAVFSPDGTLVASGGDDDRIIVWEAATGRRLDLPFAGHTGDVRSITFSPDGELLASAGHDTTVRLWDPRTGAPLGAPFTGHTGRVRTIAFSPDGGTMASGSEDGTILLWDVESRQVASTLQLDSAVNSLVFTADGGQLASAADDGRVLLWEVASGQATAVLSGHDDLVRSVALSPDGAMLASAGNDRAIRLWDAITGEPIGEPLTGHEERIFTLSFSPDGRTLASGGRDRTVILWDVATRQRVGLPLVGHTDSIRSVAFGPDAETLVTASDDRSVVVWRLDARQRLATEIGAHADPVTSMAVSDDGRLVASGSADGTVTLRDLSSGERLGEPLGHLAAVTSVAFGPGGDQLAVATADGTTVVWDVGSRAPRLEAPGEEEGAALSVAFAADGKMLAVGGEDGAVRLWDVETGRSSVEPFRGDDAVLSVSFSPDGTRLAAGGLDGRLTVWDVAGGGREGLVLNCPDGTGQRLCGRPVQAVAFSPDGRVLASGSSDTIVSLWDPLARQPGGEPARRLTGHTRGVRGIGFSPDSRTLASAGDDQQMILWDVGTGQRVGDPLVGHDAAVQEVAFSPDGTAVVSGGDDGRVLRWDVSADSWRARACRIANRELSAEEWQQFARSAGGRPRTCGAGGA